MGPCRPSFRSTALSQVLAFAGLTLAVTWLPAIGAAQAEPLLITVPGVGDDADVADDTNGIDDTPALADDAASSSGGAFSGCESAIAAAAAANDVPQDILMAIGMVESGLAPWVLNAEGTPYFLDNKADAVAQLTALQAEGIESIDVGCMQINQRWHPDAFATAEDAFDPAKNADYAARFLRSLYGLSNQSWADAVAYYHSSAQRYQRPYLCAVAARLEEMGSPIALECQPVDELDLPAVADSTPRPSGGGAAPDPAGPQHMVRVAPAREADRREAHAVVPDSRRAAAGSNHPGTAR